jgi:hypothetical protein
MLLSRWEDNCCNRWEEEDIIEEERKFGVWVFMQVVGVWNVFSDSGFSKSYEWVVSNYEIFFLYVLSKKKSAFTEGTWGKKRKKEVKVDETAINS